MTAQEVTPRAGKGALGKWRASKGNTVRTTLDRIAVPTSLDVELKIKLFNQGANAGERLSFGLNGKGLRGNAIAANPPEAEKSDRPG
jgi:hypothetical protein